MCVHLRSRQPADDPKGCAVVHATIKDIRRNGFDFDLWRGFGSLWVRETILLVVKTSSANFCVL